MGSVLTAPSTDVRARAVVRALWSIAPIGWSVALAAGVLVGTATWRLDRAAAVAAMALVPSVFASMVVHEVAHIALARRLGAARVSVGVQGWSLFVERTRATTPVGDAAIAVAGPATCVAVGFFVLAASNGLGVPQAAPLAVIWLVQGASLLPRQHDGIRLRRAWSEARAAKQARVR